MAEKFKIIDNENKKKKSKVPIVVAVIATLAVVGGVAGYYIGHKDITPQQKSNTTLAKKAGVKYTQKDYEKDKKAGPIAQVKGYDSNKAASASATETEKKSATEKPKSVTSETINADTDNMSKATQSVISDSQKVINKNADVTQEGLSTNGWKPSVSDVAASIIAQTQQMNNFVFNQYLGYPKKGQYESKGFDGVRQYNLDLINYAQTGKQPKFNSYGEKFDDQVGLIAYDMFNGGYQFTGVGDSSSYYRDVYKNYLKQGVFKIDSIDGIYLTSEQKKFDDQTSMIRADISSNGKNYVGYLTYNVQEDSTFGNFKGYKLLDLYQA